MRFVFKMEEEKIKKNLDGLKDLKNTWEFNRLVIFVSLCVALFMAGIGIAVGALSDQVSWMNITSFATGILLLIIGFVFFLISYLNFKRLGKDIDVTVNVVEGILSIKNIAVGKGNVTSEMIDKLKK